MTQVKIFWGQNKEDIEKEINDWFIQNTSFNIVDIKLSTTDTHLCAMVIYNHHRHI